MPNIKVALFIEDTFLRSLAIGELPRRLQDSARLQRSALAAPALLPESLDDQSVEALSVDLCLHVNEARILSRRKPAEFS